MSSFTEKIIVSPLDNGKEWVIRKEFYYDIGYKGSNNRVTVPAGFVTDFTSSPQMLWNIIPQWDRYGKASILHDYLYFSKEKSRKEADKIFYEAMLVSGVKKWKTKIIYWTVRMFGKKAYDKNKHYIIEPLDGYIQCSRMEWRK